MAVLATGTLADVKKLAAFPEAEHCYQILRDRKPTWKDQFAKYSMEKLEGRYFQCMRRLEREGLISVEHDSAYLSAMALGMRLRQDKQTGEGTQSRLKDDEELLDVEIWRMLEDDGAIKALLDRPSTMWAGVGNFYGAEAGDWINALSALADEGRIDRLRLLRTNIANLVRLSLESSTTQDFIRVSWFTNFHQHLKPTTEDHVALAQDYLSLLRSRDQESAAWAIEQVRLQIGNSEFPLESACEALGSVFLTKGKDNPLKAIEFLKELAQERKLAHPSVASCAAEAFSHTSPDIHKRAIALIEKYGDKENPDLVERVRQQLEYVGVANRDRLHAWLPGGTDAPTSGIASAASHVSDDGTKALAAAGDVPDVAGEIEEMKSRVSELPQTWLNIAGITSGFEALLDNSVVDLESIEFDGTEFPVLDPADELKPINDLDELIFAISKNRRTAQELEQILDAVSRLCNENPPDFAERTAPIRVAGPYDQVMGLVDAWLNKRPQVAQMIGTQSLNSPTDRILAYRFLTVSTQVASGVSKQLLAMPTHKSGFIDPVVLVQRVIDGAHVPAQVQARSKEQDKSVLDQLVSAMAPAANMVPEYFRRQLEGMLSQPTIESDDGTVLEQSLALLRLAPDHREDALRMLDDAKVAPCEFVDALRYALGANDAKVGKTATLWASAARARAPFGDDALIEKHFPDLGPDCARATRYTFAPVRHTRSTPYGGVGGSDMQFLKRDPEAVPVRAAGKIIPAEALHSYNPESYVAHIRNRMWASMIAPACMEAFFAAGIEHLADNCSSSAQSDYGEYLVPLYNADVPAKAMAMLCIAIGLTAKAHDESSAAVEALIQCIDDGRVNGRKLGEVLQLVSAIRPSKVDYNPLLVLGRWGKTLRTVAQASQYHARVVALAIEHCLSGSPAEAPKDLHALLEVLLEVHLQEQQALFLPEAREYLTGLKVTGKTQKLAKQLLALTPGAQSVQNRQAGFLHSLNRRIERVETWQARAVR